MKHFIFIALLFCFSQLSAQDAISQDMLMEKRLTEVEFARAKELYLEFRHTDEYKKVDAGIKETTRKLNGQVVVTINSSALESAEGMNRYKTKLAKKLADKIKLTDFKTVEEAVEEIVQKLTMAIELHAQYPELFGLIKKASPRQIKEITTYGKE